MANFEDIDNARKVLGLDKMATLQDIKDSYRKLSLKYHPDRCRDEEKKKCGEMFKKISDAYVIIMAYCAGYRFSFRKEDAEKANPDYAFAEYMKAFEGQVDG